MYVWKEVNFMGIKIARIVAVALVEVVVALVVGE